MKKRVILVTDGDMSAQKAIEKAAQNIGGRCISASGGNPTALPGEAILSLIQSTPYDPVVIMVDDKGTEGKGPGEDVLYDVVRNPDVEVLGVIAVASHGKDNDKRGIPVTCSINKEGRVVENSVDKNGNDILNTNLVKGDTISIIKDLNIPVIIGLGDPGKMDGNDDIEKGAPITTIALKEILSRG